MRLFVLPLAALLALAGCSSDEPAAQPPANPTGIDGGDAALDAEASANADENFPIVKADETAEWDNGLTAKIVTVTSTATTEYQKQQDGHDTVVRITVELANTGDVVFVFAENRYTGPGGPSDSLYYGVNLYTAQGWANVDGDGIDDLPKQLVPGTSATFSEEWSLPSEGLSALTFEFTPDRETLPTFTFESVESL